MLIPSHHQLEPSNSRTRVPAGGIDLIASIDFKSDGATTATLSSSTKVSQGEDTISSDEVATPNHSNQQYRIYAITDAGGNIAERYAYTAYGQPTILDAAATVLTASAIGNRYTYTAREWDATVGLYHFRARWMSGLTGRFLTRDPIGFKGSEWNLYEFLRSEPTSGLDPSGLHVHVWPIYPSSAVGFPWSDGTLDEGTLGATTMSPLSVQCFCMPCKTCSPPKKYIDMCSIRANFEIVIDVSQARQAPIPDPMPPGYLQPEWTYGHEQRHLQNAIDQLNREKAILEALPQTCMEPEACDLTAQIEAAQSRARLFLFWEDERRHMHAPFVAPNDRTTPFPPMQ